MGMAAIWELYEIDKAIAPPAFFDGLAGLELPPIGVAEWMHLGAVTSKHVALCHPEVFFRIGDANLKYKFVCKAPGGARFYKPVSFAHKVIMCRLAVPLHVQVRAVQPAHEFPQVSVTAGDPNDHERQVVVQCEPKTRLGSLKHMIRCAMIQHCMITSGTRVLLIDLRVPSCRSVESCLLQKDNDQIKKRKATKNAAVKKSMK